MRPHLLLRLRLGAVVCATLWPLSAAADVRLDPGQVALSATVLWLLLAAGVLALWAAVAVVSRMWGGTPALRPSPRTARILAAIAVVGWCLTVVGFLMLERRPRVRPPFVLNDVRVMISAQAAYESVNQGFFEGDPRCLHVPSSCIPGYAENAPTFLDRFLASPQLDGVGYRRVFHPGPAVDPGTLQSGKCSRSSVRSFAYTAVPLAPGENGIESYCGDSTGVVCKTTDGSAPEVKDGACVLAGPRAPAWTSQGPPKGCWPLS